MATTTKVKASLLIKDYNLYPRGQINSYNVQRIKQILEAGYPMPPIVADKTSYRIVDGFHRVTAYQSLFGPDIEIDVVLQKYASEAELFKAAIDLNANHGQALSTYDRVRCLVIGEKLGLTRDDLSGVLKLSRDRADHLLLNRVSLAGEVLKRTTEHFAGHDLDAEQSSYNRRAGGHNQLYYINQVVQLLASDSVDWEKSSVREGLKRLS